MAKSREGKDIEFYRGEVRRLKSENRNLKKRLKQLEKSRHIYKELKLNEDEEPEYLPDIEVTLCQSCYKGNLVSTDLAHGVLITCSSCEFRKFIKNG